MSQANNTNLGAGGGRRTLARTVVAGVVAFVVGGIAATSVAAATGSQGQSLVVSPSTVTRGSTVNVSGVAPNCNTVTVLSHAFPDGNQFAGVPAVQATSTGGGHFHAAVRIPSNRAPGYYSVMARACGGNLGLTVTLTVTAATPTPSTGSAIGTAQVTAALLLTAAGACAMCAATLWRRWATA